MMRYFPEGMLLDSYENKRYQRSEEMLMLAREKGKILENIVVMCDANHDLWIDFGFIKGVIRRIDGACGIEDGSTRDIALITRVNKPVCFTVGKIVSAEDGERIVELSRKDVQLDCMKNYIRRLCPGDIIPARVSHLESFGAFVDIGCGIASLIPIDLISVSRISHPKDRFTVGSYIKAVVRQVDENGRVSLSHKELLGTWEQNAGRFSAGETVSGIVRSVESYGIFVELAPNLAGLAELKEGISAGQTVSVFIKTIIPERMKIKLIIIDSCETEQPPSAMKYFIDDGHISYWRFSPEGSVRLIESRFDGSQA
ncbi:MAG: S1 RNA-binding domain-containing protein [Clostridia bacterium]|nr:S1 RNA-binding domain-containing protein [Clostridia bacterium]